jgi:hypothetical protein
MTKRKASMTLAAGLALATVSALIPAHAASPGWFWGGSRIPQPALDELQRCRNDHRPEDECQGRMALATDLDRLLRRPYDPNQLAARSNAAVF